ncbi:MAG: MBL fold metallo-hydrolase, partial [Chlamydiia bacterium]|nr:MBL fold metallo-hydrolase [Chlamydiia bacterium]
FATWDGSPPRLLFPNATFYTGKRQWEHACHPHPRDRASYVPETLELLKASGRLRLIEGETHPDLDFPVSFLFFDGHSPGMAVSRLALPHGVLYFVADLIPGAAWVHIPIVMGYDRFAELTIDEKTAFLGRVMQEDAKLYFTHDPLIACAGVDMDEKGRYTAFASDIERLVLSEVAQ